MGGAAVAACSASDATVKIDVRQASYSLTCLYRDNRYGLYRACTGTFTTVQVIIIFNAEVRFDAGLADGDAVLLSGCKRR